MSTTSRKRTSYSYELPEPRRQRGQESGGGQVKILKALADAMRLRLLRLLMQEELNVQELCQILNVPQPRVSRHLAVLREAGLVSDRREGPKVYYCLAEFTGERSTFQACVEQLCSGDHPDLGRLKDVLEERTRSAHSFADSKAAQWDEVGKVLHSTSASLLALANLAPRNLVIADLGTGTGLLLPVLAAMADKVYAVDQSTAMLQHARRRCRSADIDNVEFIQQPLEELGRNLPPCDALLLHFVLHQIARPPVLLKNIRSCLKPGGRLVIVDRMQHQDEQARTMFGSLWLGFSETQVRQWLADAGLVNPYWRQLTGNDLTADTAFGIFVAAAQTAPGAPAA